MLNLRTVLIADAAVCALFFVVGVFDAHLLSPLLGLPESVIRAAGWICLPVAALLGFLASQAQPSRALLSLVAVGNLGWVVASLAVLVTFSETLTTLGIAIVIAQAIAVLGVAAIEWQGARQSVAA